MTNNNSATLSIAYNARPADKGHYGNVAHWEKKVLHRYSKLLEPEKFSDKELFPFETSFTVLFT
jgi:hypothetical protein